MTSRASIIFVFIGALVGYPILPVNAQITREVLKNTPYFSIKYEKNQASVVVRAIPVNQLTSSKTSAPQKDNTLLKDLLSYDTKLPYVSYTVKDPKNLEKYIDGQISETAKKQKVTLKTATPAQMARLALAITVKDVHYDDRMVTFYPQYDLKHDDYISALPLDTLITKEHQGVCRQLAAVYEYIAKRIITTSKSPFLKNTRVDEVVSYDYNHAYNVIYNVVYDKNKGTSVEMAFVDPTVAAITPDSKSWDALDSRHDVLFSELVKSNRYKFSTPDEEALLTELAKFGQQGEISRIQAYAELMNDYNQEVIKAINSNNHDESIATLANSITNVTIKDLPTQSPESKIMERYKENRALMQKLYSMASQQKTN